MAVLDIYIAYIVDWDRFIQVLYLGRAPRTKETLPDFLKWRRATRHPLVFRELTGSQRTPGIGASQRKRTLYTRLISKFRLQYHGTSTSQDSPVSCA